MIALLAYWKEMLAVILIAGAGYLGWHEKAIRDQADLEAAQARIVVQMGKSEVITEQVAQVVEIQQVQIQGFTTLLVSEVTRYVTAKADAACVVPLGFERVLDAAAGGAAVPDAAGSVDDAAGIPLSAIASSVARNYGTCRSEIARLAALQDWIRQQQALAGGK